jgi:hypothetical protein
LALATDPSDSESHTVLAVMAGMFDYDWNRAEKRFGDLVGHASRPTTSYELSKPFGVII